MLIVVFGRFFFADEDGVTIFGKPLEGVLFGTVTIGKQTVVILLDQCPEAIPDIREIFPVIGPEVRETQKRENPDVLRFF